MQRPLPRTKRHAALGRGTFRNLPTSSRTIAVRPTVLTYTEGPAECSLLTARLYTYTLVCSTCGTGVQGQKSGVSLDLTQLTAPAKVAKTEFNEVQLRNSANRTHVIQLNPSLLSTKFDGRLLVTASCRKSMSGRKLSFVTNVAHDVHSECAVGYHAARFVAGIRA